MASNGNMSHDEIWDDSLLVDSWNEALEEYKHYHSIHARGERVEDVLKHVENRSSGIAENVDYEEGEVDDQMHDSHVQKDLPEGSAGRSVTGPGRASKVEKPQSPVSNLPSGGAQSNDSALPQHLIGQVHDEGLKNLLMSWYYAGYYTGLYEGQRQRAGSKDA